MCLISKGGWLKCRVTSGENMGKQLWQCKECGQVKYAKIPYKADSDDIYKTCYCKQCRTETKWLWCGEDILDFYSLYDVTKDLRYYLTVQN